MNVPHQSMIVASNEVLKKFLQKHKVELGFWTYFSCASIAGFVASCITMPLDNIRTRMNTQCDLIAQIACPDKVECQCTKERQGNIKYRNSWVTFSEIFRSEGVKGFYKGLVPRAMTQSLSAAVSWSMYEMIKKSLNRAHHQSKH